VWCCGSWNFKDCRNSKCFRPHVCAKCANPHHKAPRCSAFSNPTSQTQLFEGIQKSGQSLDVRQWNALISASAKTGDTKRCMDLFQKMEQQGIKPNEVTWNTLISSFAKSGDTERCMDLFQKMEQQGIKPDEVTWTTLTFACGKGASLELGKHLHCCIMACGIMPSEILNSALIAMYAKSGSLRDAEVIYHGIPEDERDVVVYTAMISGYGVHGNGKEAMKVYEEMQHKRVKPNEITFIALLNACSHAGMVNEAEYLFDCMETEFGIIPAIEHKTCMVDVYGRSGDLEKAKNFLHKISQPSAATWTALLGAYKTHGNVEGAEYVAQKILELEPTNAATYVLLANIYRAAGHSDAAKRVREQMDHCGVKKIPGQTWVEVNGKRHTFVVHDQSHESTEEIYHKLRELIAEAKEAGYSPITSLVLHDVSEETKEELICYHSEKLAIAYLHTVLDPFSYAQGPAIQKNLRSCLDCHNFFKTLTKLYPYELPLRDANRFHIFKNGQCSCGDYY